MRCARKHSFIKEVRGKGLMIAIEFHEPNEFKLKMAWKLLHKVDKVLFAQMVVTQMIAQHRIPDPGRWARHGCGKDSPAAHHRREAKSTCSSTALDATLTECRKFPAPCGRSGIISSGTPYARSVRPDEPRPVSSL